MYIWYFVLVSFLIRLVEEAFYLSPILGKRNSPHLMELRGYSLLRASSHLLWSIFLYVLLWSFIKYFAGIMMVSLNLLIQLGRSIRLVDAFPFTHRISSLCCNSKRSIVIVQYKLFFFQITFDFMIITYYCRFYTPMEI